jgi:hypothetical protein
VPAGYDKAGGRGAGSGTQQTCQAQIIGGKDRRVRICCRRCLGERVGPVPVPCVSGSSCRHEWGEERRQSPWRRRYASFSNLNTPREELWESRSGSVFFRPSKDRLSESVLIKGRRVCWGDRTRNGNRIGHVQIQCGSGIQGGANPISGKGRSTIGD